MPQAQLWVTILGAGGGGAILLAIIKAVVDFANGSAGREKQRNTDLVTQRNNAVRERDNANAAVDLEARKRRKTEEYASSLRRQLIENGLTPGDWPGLDMTLPGRPDIKE